MYATISDSIFGSSIMEEEAMTRLVFFYLLGLCDEEGTVDATDQAIARRCNLPEEAVAAACAALNKPDPASRSSEEEGRRIVPLEGQPFGWQIVNFARYQEAAADELDGEPKRRKSEPKRRKSDATSRAHARGVPRTSTSTSTPVLQPLLFKNARTEPKRRKSGGEPPGFDAFWAAYPRKQKRLDAKKAWKQTRDLRPDLDTLLAAIENQKKGRDWTKNSGQFVPLPATWLRAGSWDDEPAREPSPYRTE